MSITQEKTASSNPSTNKHNNNNNNINNNNHPSMESLMNTLSADIYKFYTSSRPYSTTVIEKEKLKTYIVECGKWLQSQCIDDLKRYNKNHNNKRNHIQLKDDNDHSIKIGDFYGKLEFLDTMSRSENMIHNDRDWDIFTFGSESWGTSCHDSDIDMAIFVNFRNKKPDKKYLLAKLATIIGKFDNDGLLYVKQLLNAKYPIIRITQMRYNIKIDVSIADRFCKRRDQTILQIINQFENQELIPVKELIVFIKYWSKQKGINNSYLCYLNSFGYTLFVIKFLQYYCFHLSSDKNYNRSLGYLVYKFFEFYAKKYDVTKHAISIVSDYNYYDDGYLHHLKTKDGIFNRKQYYGEINGFAQMEINDPINLENNVAHKIGPFQCQQIMNQFVEAYKLIKHYKNNQQQQRQSLFNLLVEKPYYLNQYNHFYQPYRPHHHYHYPHHQKQQESVQDSSEQEQLEDMQEDQAFIDNLLKNCADADKHDDDDDDDDNNKGEDDEVVNAEDDKSNDVDNERSSVVDNDEVDDIDEEEKNENVDITSNESPLLSAENQTSSSTQSVIIPSDSASAAVSVSDTKLNEDEVENLEIEDLDEIAEIVKQIEIENLSSNHDHSVTTNSISNSHQCKEDESNCYQSHDDEKGDNRDDNGVYKHHHHHGFFTYYEQDPYYDEYNNQYVHNHHGNNNNNNNNNNNGNNGNNNNNNSYYYYHSNYSKADNQYQKSPFRGNNNRKRRDNNYHNNNHNNISNTNYHYPHRRKWNKMAHFV